MRETKPDFTDASHGSKRKFAVLTNLLRRQREPLPLSDLVRETVVGRCNLVALLPRRLLFVGCPLLPLGNQKGDLSMALPKRFVHPRKCIQISEHIILISIKQNQKELHSL